MGLVLKHVERTPSGTFQYRRRVPKDVAEVIGKVAFKKKLGNSRNEALAAYPRFHARVEREIEEARRRLALVDAASSPTASQREAYAEALRRRADLIAAGATEDDLAMTADGMADAYPQDEYEPVGVPLVGDALTAAKEALRLPRDGDMAFPSYGRKRGSDAASAALMKHLRAVTTDPKHVIHSLRHNMKDRLILAEVSSLDQNLILGHTPGGVGDSVYGGRVAKLRATTRAMKKALGVVEEVP